MAYGVSWFFAPIIITEDWNQSPQNLEWTGLYKAENDLFKATIFWDVVQNKKVYRFEWIIQYENTEYNTNTKYV